MKIIFKKAFSKNYKKIIKSNIKIKQKFLDCINDFKNNSFDSKYYRKPLKNLGKNIHELQIGGDIRIIIELLIIEDKCYLLNIGTHSTLELTGNKRVIF